MDLDDDLSGIHTASYGVDLDEKVTLVDLLEDEKKSME